MDLSGTQASPGGSAASPHLLEHVEQWLSKRWVPVVINLAALALLSFSLARGTWRLLTPPPAPELPPAFATAGATGAEYNLQTLLAANLFGQVAVTGKSLSLDAIPLSSLNLVLTGVMVTPAGSFALISADGRPELPFGIGEEVAAGVSLYEVYPDRVLIRRGAATESLMLKDTSTGLPDGSIILGGPRTAAAPAPARSSRPSGVQAQSDNRFAIDRKQLTQQMQTPEFLTQALMVPNAGGGFLVREIQPGSVYEKLGLRVGDVIQSVNGQPVNAMEDVMRLYQQFESTSHVSVEVRRAGQTQTLVYNIQ